MASRKGSSARTAGTKAKAKETAGRTARARGGKAPARGGDQAVRDYINAAVEEGVRLRREIEERIEQRLREGRTAGQGRTR